MGEEASSPSCLCLRLLLLCESVRQASKHDRCASRSSMGFTLWTGVNRETWQLGTRKELASLFQMEKYRVKVKNTKIGADFLLHHHGSIWPFLCTLQTSKGSYGKIYYHAVPSQLFKLLTREHLFPDRVVEETKLCQYVIIEITFLRGNFQKQP